MVEIDIYVGNTVYLQIVPTLNGEEYLLQGNDKVYVTIRNACYEKVIEKVLTVDNYLEEKLILKLEPNDTKDLEPQVCNFDCSIMIGDDFFTFIVPSRLNINKPITQYNDIIASEV